MAYRLETIVATDSNLGYIDNSGIEKCYIIAGIRNYGKPQENVLCDVETLANVK